MNKLDKFEQLACDATYSAGILGNGTEYELVDMPLKKSEEQLTKESQSKNFGFIGIIGIVGGRIKVALALPLDEMTIDALSQAFAQRIDEAISTVEKAMTGDSTQFLQRLHDLQDNREGMN
jgi:hypothetical protein